MKWDPDCYNRFRKQRKEPFRDLLKLVKVRQPITAIDLGCGTGEITEKLANKLPGSSVVGIDSSKEMLERAKVRERPGLRFELGSIDELEGQWDLIFSNSALQWIDNHNDLMTKLFSKLSVGGRLVVQVPSNHSHPTYTLPKVIAEEGPFRIALKGWVRNSPVLSISEYALSLYENGGRDIVIFEKIYPHVLNDVNAIVDWMRGTVLIPYLDRLPRELHESFIESYRERLMEKWPRSPVFFPYRRILFAATHT